MSGDVLPVIVDANNHYLDGAPVAPVPVEYDAGLLDQLNIDGRPVTIVRDISTPAAGTPVAHKYVVRG